MQGCTKSNHDLRQARWRQPAYVFRRICDIALHKLKPVVGNRN
jgi:hypothetical protein